MPALADPGSALPSLPSELVVRERVIRLLDDAVERPLTVLSAPAGYGKTTAVVTWLDARGAECAWLSLDARDNDPRRLRGRLSTALAVHGRFVVVVLDDYHVIEHPDCHRLVGELTDALPATVRLVVCSRTRPPLRLARRRGLGTAAELGWRELRFQAEEAERLLNGVLRLGLEPNAIAAIAGPVEGWPAGLVLSARKPEAIAGYVDREVLDRTGSQLRTFLLQTSILRRLRADVCEAVLDDPAAHTLLDEARRSGLLVERGDTWLRHYRPFVAVLERELIANSPQLAAELHRRAAAWFAGNGLPEEAIRHAGAAGDGARAAELLRDGWRALLLARRHVSVRRLISLLPADRGRLAGFCEALDTLCQWLDGGDAPIVAERLVRLGDAPAVAPVVDLMRVSHRFGDAARAVSQGRAAWERDPDIRSRAMLAGPFGAALWVAGERAAVRDVVEPLVGVIGAHAGRTWALAALALAAVDDGDAELAERHARDAVEGAVAHDEGVALGRAFAHVALAEALRLLGRFDEAADQLAAASGLTAASPDSVDHALTLVFEAALAVARHDRNRAEARAVTARAIVDRHPDLGVLSDRLARVENALRHGVGEHLEGTEPTPAERRLLALLASELTLDQIAAALHLSVHTVKSHRRRLYRRLGVRSREDAVAVARERGQV